MNQQFRRTRMAVAISLANALSGGVMQAIAQDAPPNDENFIEEVLVTGYRASIERAMELKRYSTNIVDAISAEDIGKLPDSSIADSLARVPGLTTQRLDGRATFVSVRGFGDDEVLTTFNGREQVSIGDSRGVEFDLYPSEIMNGVTVYKTPSANMIGEGIAGVIDLQSVKPLNRKERTVQINSQYEMNEYDALVPGYDSDGFRGTLSYIDQFNDNIGVALAVTTMESPGQEKHFGRHGGPFLIEADGMEWMKGANLKARSSLLERDSVLGVVQFSPNESVDIVIDGLYVDFNDERYIGAVEMAFNGCIEGWLACSYQENNADGNFVTSATFPDMPTYFKNNQELRAAELKNFGINVTWDVNETWSVVVDASQSKVDRDLEQLVSFGGAASGDFAGQSVTYTASPNGDGGTFSQTLDYSDASQIGIGDIMGWGLAGELSQQHVEDEIKAFGFAAKHTLDGGFLESIEFGARYRERDKSKGIQYYKQDVLDSAKIPGTNIAAIPQEYLMGTVDLGFVGFGNSLVFDQAAVLSSGNIYSNTDVTYAWGKINDAFQISEEVLSFFAQANIDTQMGGIPVRGNVGLRYIDTDQSSVGDVFGWSGVNTKIDYGHSYDHLLPSLNLIADLNDEMMLRFGLSKNISRPVMDDMKGGILIEPTSWSGASADTDQYGNYWKASGGNYALEPREAISYDISFEHYFTEEGYYSIAFFYKDIENWNFDSTYFEENLGLDAAALATHPVAAYGDNPNFSETRTTVSAKENGGSGELYGVELSATIPFTMFSDSLEGFGLQIAHTIVDQSMKDFAGDKYELPGLSDKYTQATVYYENHGLQARVSMRKRSDYVATTYATIGLARENRFGVGETLVDAQIGYDVTDNLYVFLQGQNLTNEKFLVKFEDDPYATDRYLDYGANYQLGFTWKAF